MKGNDGVGNIPIPSASDDKSEGKSVRAIRSLVFETVDLFHRLVFVHEQMHGMPPGKRGILMSLGQFGPQTVPQLTSTRPVSRQYIQKVVNQLHDDGLVEFVHNPAHKRSSLVRVTKVGFEVLKAIQELETNLFSQIALSVNTEDVDNAAKVLKSLRHFFESNVWVEIVNEANFTEDQ